MNLSGASLTKISEKKKVLTPLKKAFQNLCDHLKTMFIITITFQGSI